MFGMGDDGVLYLGADGPFHNIPPVLECVPAVAFREHF